MKLNLLLLLFVIITPIIAQDQIAAVQGLIQRIIPDYQNVFQLELIQNPTDVFELQSNGSQIILRGTTGVAIASGLHYYLKYYCFCQISWTGDQLNLPKTPPQVVGVVRIGIPMTYRYYFNVCTFGYTTVWWDWARWQREIDWMALNGVNLPLAFTGQESVWRAVYIQLGLTDEDLTEFFTGPAFLPWQRMGNVNGWGGGLSLAWLKARTNLQLQILAQMRSFGMKPVLPAFAGHVPLAIKNHFPSANITQLAPWSSFNGTYLLAPNDPLFSKIGALFLQLQTATYGTDHYYNTDLFNELVPPSSDPTYLASTSNAVYSYMAQVDKSAVWVMQGWFLYFARDFWQANQTKAFLDAVPSDNLLMLDLWSEVFPIWSSTDSFYGKQFVWCMLHNFGGRTGMYGKLPTIASQPAVAYQQADNLVGMGLTPEAIEANVIVYDMMMEMPWRVSLDSKGVTDLDGWVKNFTLRRYGLSSPEISQAWSTLQNTIYACNNTQSGPTPSFIALRPQTSLPSVTPSYDIKVVPGVLQNLISAAERNPELAELPTFQHDIAAVTRQMITDAFVVLYTNMMTAYNTNDTSSFNRYTSAVLQAILDTEAIVGTQSMWLLGNWIENAKSWATTPEELAQYEFNARNQLTLWGEKTSHLTDYADKLWGGLVVDYYHTRWSFFVDTLTVSFYTGVPFDWDTYLSNIQNLEYAWSLANNSFPTQPSGDPFALAVSFYDVYAPIINN